MQIGIIGLPNSTKTTIFNALTRSQVETAAYSTGRVETNTATVRVPDPRIDRLSAMFKPRKTTWAQIEYNDIAGLRIGIGREGGLSGPLMNAVSQNDAFLHVVRAFQDEDVPHPIGSIDPTRDLAAMDFELLFHSPGIPGYPDPGADDFNDDIFQEDNFIEFIPDFRRNKLFPGLTAIGEC